MPERHRPLWGSTPLNYTFGRVSQGGSPEPGRSVKLSLKISVENAWQQQQDTSSSRTDNMLHSKASTIREK